MPAEITVASANVQCTLSTERAGKALRLVLEREPDVVGLQEWSLRRLGVLRRTGPTRLLAPGVPDVALGGRGGYVWLAPVVGGCALGWRRDRFDLVRARSVPLSRPGRSDRRPGRPSLEPGRVATVAWLVDRRGGVPLGVVDYHLVYGVRRGEGYRTDRPVLVGRHQHERAALERVVAQLRREGEVHALGDANLLGLTLPGLTSAWPAGSARIDDVLGPGEPSRVELVTTPSDHAAVVVTRRR